MELSFVRVKKYTIIFLIIITTYLVISKTKQLSSIFEVKYIKVINIQENCSDKLLKIKENSHCGRFPTFNDLNVSDINWQVTNTTNGTFHLFNAYFDDREALKNNSVVRILALINRIDVSLKAYCQFWFNGTKNPIHIEVQQYTATWPSRWGTNNNGATPYIITCPNPLANVSLVPQFVSFVEQECGNANNVLEIRNKRPKNGHKGEFLVSVKALDFQDDISLQLIEWLEILKIFGVNKVELFIVNVHQNVIHVLKMYQAEDLVTIKFIKFPHEYPNQLLENPYQWLQSELVAYHDSFYENLYLYDFMVPLDIDEFIIPKNNEDRTWSDMLNRLFEVRKIKDEVIDAFPAMNMYFLLQSIHKHEAIPGIPKNLRFLTNIYRAANFTPKNGGVKTFMKMDRVEILHNHFPQKCLNTSQCKWHVFPPEIGQNVHYKTKCPNPECRESLLNPVKDTTLWKYKDEILENVQAALKRLKEFKSDFGVEVFDIKLD